VAICHCTTDGAAGALICDASSKLLVLGRVICCLITRGVELPEKTLSSENLLNMAFLSCFLVNYVNISA
jgi:hypothetical protein